MVAGRFAFLCLGLCSAKAAVKSSILQGFRLYSLGGKQIKSKEKNLIFFTNLYADGLSFNTGFVCKACWLRHPQKPYLINHF
jgi:hypothetical protein